MKPKPISERLNLKAWFEANFLDGDKIQEGQVFSSSFAFEAVEAAIKSERERMIKIGGKMFKGRVNKKLNVRLGTHNERVYNQAITEYQQKIRELK